MPQKRNPIAAEVVIGLAGLGTAFGSALAPAMQPGHERATGEWQTEWDAVPLTCAATAGALAQLGDLLAGLEVHPEAMRRNLALDGGLIMSEAVMMRLAEALGRRRAHRLVYDVAQSAHAAGIPLADALLAEPEVAAVLGGEELATLLEPAAYTGEAAATARAAVAAWRLRSRAWPSTCGSSGAGSSSTARAATTDGSPSAPAPSSG
jgi:3-carboxy-cis,cis-muconate cycloisomerase